MVAHSIEALNLDSTRHSYHESISAGLLRVLLIAPSLDILGGQAVQAQRLLNNLRREPGLEVDFLPINPRFPGSIGRLQRRIKYLRTVLTSILYLTKLLRQVPRYNVVHVSSAAYFSFVLASAPAILVARFCGKSIVLNYHSGHAKDHLRRWRRTAIPTIKLADEIVVPSSYLVDVFSEFGLKARAIYNTVETERFIFRERSPLRPIFLSNRNFEPHYNVACTLRAFSLIQKRFPEALLIIAGDGSERDRLHDLAVSLGLRNVEFLGAVPPHRMPELYDRAHIFLNSPNVDNMPNSIIEAFAAGTPVVTTDAGGIPYIVTHERTGLLVPKNDHEKLAASAIRLIEDQELALRIIANAHDECRKYVWENVRHDWLSLYERLAGYGEVLRKSKGMESEEVASFQER